MIRRSSFRQEMVSLYLVQAISYAAPLALLPLLISRLGLSGYGTYALYQSCAALVIAIVEFGFSWTAATQISKEAELGGSLRRIYSDYFYAQIGVFIVATIIVCPIIFLIFSERNIRFPVLLISAFQAVSLPLSAAWAHQSLRKSHYLALSQLIGKGLTLVGCVILIRKPSDLSLSITITSAATVAGSFLPFGASLINPRLGLAAFRWHRSFERVREAWALFLAKIFSTCYLIGLPLIVAYWTTPEVNGYFSLIDKVRRALLTMLAPPFQYLIPKLATTDGKSIRLLSVAALLTTLATTLSIIMIMTWPNIARFLTKNASTEPALLLVILGALTIPIVTISNIVAQLILIPNGINKLVRNISAIGAVLGFAFAGVLLPLIPSTAPTLALLLTELCVMVMFLVSLSRNNYSSTPQRRV